jgi:hypothetical protein
MLEGMALLRSQQAENPAGGITCHFAPNAESCIAMQLLMGLRPTRKT